MNKLLKKITDEVSSRGPISFARYMELALYCPEYGYYEKIEDRIGRFGDYYTSVSVGDMFGSLLAAQFLIWHEKLGAQPLVLVEAGAHEGKLAADILRYLREERPDEFRSTEYVILEPSTARQSRQAQKLNGFSGMVRWAKDFNQLSAIYPGGIRGIIFCNELLDALPFRRWRWNKELKRWNEVGVCVSNGELEWCELEDVTLPFEGMFHVLDIDPCPLAEAVPHGFVYDECAGALDWWGGCAKVLANGRVIAFDYGFTWEEFLKKCSFEGSLRSYRKHQFILDVLKNPGEQDITGHVNFSELVAAGEASGLETVSLEYQSRFLTQIAAGLLAAKGGQACWEDSQTRQFRTLTHPSHLGERFRVLVQESNLRRKTISFCDLHNDDSGEGLLGDGIANARSVEAKASTTFRGLP